MPKSAYTLLKSANTVQKSTFTLLLILTNVVLTATHPVESPKRVGLYSFEFLQILLKMGINPWVEHWPISGGRSVSGEFKDESHFEGTVHYPEHEVKGKFINFEPSGKVIVTSKEGTVVNI